MTKRIEDLRIIDNKQLAKDFYVLELKCESDISHLRPGQFVQVKVDGSQDTFLRRPISIHDVDYQNNTIKLLIQVVGKGTDAMSKLSKGDFLNIIYPLGNSFSIPSRGQIVLLVGGGCGIAPLLFLARDLKAKGFVPVIILGFRNKDRVIEIDDYKLVGEVFVTTEDGSMGEKGYVTDHSILKSQRFDKVYCCGPESMMKAVAQFAKTNKVNCEVSLENLMACGIGICLCCIVDTTKGNLCTCTEGPVFNINDLKW
jgi:dihydroorotate dehydrogenase electron transfer subunit